MRKLKINEHLEQLIPKLTSDEFNSLEASIVNEGCRDAITVWENTIVDGHNRYRICSKHNIPFEIREKTFDSEDDAVIWMIDNQFARRNIPEVDRILLAQKKAEIFRRKATKNKSLGAEKTNAKKNNDLAKFGQTVTEPVATRDEVAKLAGVSHGKLSQFEQVQKKKPELIEEIRNGEMTVNKAFTKVKQEEKKKQLDEEIQKQIESPRESKTVELNEGKKYRIIYADPPWSYGDKCEGGGVQSRGADGVYPTMSLQEICDLPIPSEDNAVLFLWTTSPMLEEAFSVIKAWGFKYKSSFVWDKVKHNMGHYNSVRHEFLLIATKGSCVPDVPKLHDSVVSIERGEHSEKPEKFREIIDEIYPVGERLELFARKSADGWDVWGNMV